MLIALFTILIFGVSNTGVLDFIGDIQDTVKVVMEKDDKRDEALTTLKAIKKRMQAYNKSLKSSSKDMNNTQMSDEGTDADVDTIWDAFFAQKLAYDQDIIDLRFQLKDQMTREEWQEVFSGN
jgi:hypothetical protein